MKRFTTKETFLKGGDCITTLVFLSVFFLYLGVVFIVVNGKEEKVASLKGSDSQTTSLSLETLSTYFKALFGFMFPKNLQYQTIRRQLNYSKWKGRTVEEFITIRILCILIPLAIGFFLYFLDPLIGFFFGFTLTLLGLLTPGAALKSNIRKRTESQEKEILGFTELLFSASGGGINQFQALKEAARSSDGVLGELIHDALLDISADSTKSEALLRIKEFTSVREVRYLIDDLVLSINNGTPFRDAVNNILDNMYKMKDEINSRKAQKLQSHLTLVVLTVMMPGLFILSMVLPAIGVMFPN